MKKGASKNTKEASKRTREESEEENSGDEVNNINLVSILKSLNPKITSKNGLHQSTRKCNDTYVG